MSKLIPGEWRGIFFNLLFSHRNKVGNIFSVISER